MISSIVQIQDIIDLQKHKLKSIKPINIVAPIASVRTKSVAETLIKMGNINSKNLTLDVLLPREMTSGIMTQVINSLFS